MDEFLLALENLITHEANNGDYYLDGYVDAGALEELINKFFPEREFTSYGTYSRWYGPRPKHPNDGMFLRLIESAYARQIKDQLAQEAGFMHRLFEKPEPPKVGDTVTFKIYNNPKDDNGP